MSIKGLVGTILNVSGMIRDLESLGIRVEIGDDFSEYRVRRNALADRNPIYPMFDVSCSYVDSSNAFWVLGFDDNDELVHTQAVRLLDLTGKTLAQHISVHRHKYITPNSTPDPDLTFYSGPDIMRRVTGTVCYHGEFWLKPADSGGPRGWGVTPLLSRILHELAVDRWKPDYIFGLINKGLALKGAHLRYGYIHCESGKWTGPDEQVTDEDFLVWMSANDLTSALGKAPPVLEESARAPSHSASLKALSSAG